MIPLSEGQEFRKALIALIKRVLFGRERRMITGKRIDDETITMADAPAGKFWVRSTDNSREQRAVWGDISQPNIRVIIDLNSDNEYEFKRLDYYAAQQAFGAAMHALALPRMISSVVRLLLEGRDFKPGRVRVWTPGTLIVNASEFWYRDSAGARKKWVPLTANALTVAAPAASGGVNQHRWTVVALNPSATAPALVAFNGTSYPTTMPLLETDSATISVTTGYYVLGTVQVETGDTTLDEADFIEPREFLDASSIQGVGGIISYAAVVSTSPYDLDWDTAGQFELTLGANVIFTFSNLAAGKAITLLLIQDATGGRTVTWPASVNWLGGTPTLQTAPNATDIFVLFVRDNGVTVIGTTVGGGTVSPLTTAGDLYTFDADNARLPVGANGTILTPDSSLAMGLKWTLPQTLSGVNHLHGLARWVADGTLSTFDLPDIAEYLELVFDDGVAVDPVVVSLSTDGTQVVFDSAPGAASILQATYVIASL